MQQARLAHAGISHDVDLAQLLARLGERALKDIQFALAPNKGAEAPADRRIEPRGTTQDGVESIDLLRLGLALDRTLARSPAKVVSTRPCTRRCVASLR
jgi:hypothetical protein